MSQEYSGEDGHIIDKSTVKRRLHDCEYGARCNKVQTNGNIQEQETQIQLCQKASTNNNHNDDKNHSVFWTELISTHELKINLYQNHKNRKKMEDRNSSLAKA